ncbi:sulfite exporter TauE/SafE family protein [Ruegeria sediminis]|uniref:Probable membrane transporter protein n=1 Tax=Ruegeria sediminis TaxID=2583820 RepID=A0ABY2X3K7_9RHOB|nr:sulfite exporter TauE/SafE family protein [Ruegeria sediminis]TMV09962.1 sulfite exporter TauE/SafE family protein [Ruegeria sediminis]
MDSFLTFLAVGFVAQLADGALGMGFGVISSSVLLFQGFPPPLVSASVNAAKIPTGSMAGISHALNGNIDFSLFRRLALSGMAGGIVGALILGELKRPFLTVLIAAFLIGIGSLILWRGITGRAPRLLATRRMSVIGAAGGLIEGIGGSWGPIVTSSLIGSGTEPRRAIGSSALAELVVSAIVFAVLLMTFQAGHWGGDRALSDVLMPVAGLVAGGVPAAFIGGRLAAVAPKRPLTIAVGLLALGIGLQRLSTLI